MVRGSSDDELTSWSHAAAYHALSGNSMFLAVAPPGPRSVKGSSFQAV
ncbi:Uncharacterised protein [Mycobacteroides abscessus subsp. abscessus]|nr:Uncharacterised protein [Mycobacteroides abscessus subsp. abscessus]